MGMAKGLRAQKWLLPQVASATSGFLPTGFLPTGLLPRREATAAMQKGPQTPTWTLCLGGKLAWVRIRDSLKERWAILAQQGFDLLEKRVDDNKKKH